MDDAQLLERVFQTIGKANRLKIIQFIGEKERSVSEIVEFTGLSQPLVSHHLKTLRKSDILSTQRNGPFIYHRLKDVRLLGILGLFLEIAKSMNGQENHNPLFSCPHGSSIDLL